jgi:hypothetical protein
VKDEAVMTSSEGNPGHTGNAGNAVHEVFVVMQSKANPSRDVVVAVCSSRARAERYVATESHDGDMHIEMQQLLH